MSARRRTSARKRRRKQKRRHGGRPQALPPRRGGQDKDIIFFGAPVEAPPVPVDSGQDAQERREDRHQAHRNVPLRTRHMTPVDFFTYVVSSFRTSCNLAFILFVSAILFVAVTAGFALMASHLHFGAITPFTSEGLTVGLTSAGTLLVAAIAWMVRRGRRRDFWEQEDDDILDPEEWEGD